MKERGILFSAPMVRALLADTKTQTRRVLKPQPTHFNPAGTPRRVNPDGGPSAVVRCPYGQPGDQLWVRETWAVPHRFDHLGPSNIPPDGARVHYAATEDRCGLRWRPSIHMCRWASRITLEITGVRVERLQDISEPDARAEGVEYDPGEGGFFYVSGLNCGADSAAGSYHRLWDSINGAGSWAANPWAWVVSFRRLDG